MYMYQGQFNLMKKSRLCDINLNSFFSLSTRANPSCLGNVWKTFSNLNNWETPFYHFDSLFNEKSE